MFERPRRERTNVVSDARIASNSAVDRTTEYEDEVHKLLEASAAASSQHMRELGLQKARDAAKCERALCKYREVWRLYTFMCWKCRTGSWSSRPSQW